MFVIAIVYPAIWTRFEFTYGVLEFDYGGSPVQKKRTQNCRTKYVKINKLRRLDCALFCCKTHRRRARAWKNCKGKNKTQSGSVSLYFLSVNPWTLNFSIFSSLHSLLALCVRSHHSLLALLACCFSLSSFWLAKCSPQRLGKACVEEADVFIHVCWDAKF